MDLSKEMAKDAEENQGEKMEDKLARLGELLKYLDEAEEVVATKEKELKEAKEKASYYSSTVIPDYFDSIGLSAVKMDNGKTVSIEDQVSASITKKNESEAHAYLRKTGLGDIIKHKIEIEKRGESFDQVREFLNKLAMTYGETEKVHPQTLKAIIREKIQNGEDFPQNLFSVYISRKTKIK